MIQTNPNADGSRANVPFRFGDISVSWAGQGERDDQFCIGAEDGQLRFTTVDGGVVGGFVRTERDPEAVNGVAFIGPVVAISNRREVIFWTSVPGKIVATRAVFPCGAHGVIATAGGRFIAPLGRTGLLEASIGPQGQQQTVVTHAPQQIMDFYRVVDLHCEGRPEVLACAVRLHGIAVSELVESGGHSLIRSLTFPGLDVVDVCSLGTGANPPAVAALDKRGTLVLLRNVLNDPSPVYVGFPAVTGTAYRVFCAQGNMLVLTSAGLFVLVNLARRFLEGEAVERSSTTIRLCRLEAVDANLCGQRWLLAVLPDQVIRFDVDQLAAGLPLGEFAEAKPSVGPLLPGSEWQSYSAMVEPMPASSG